MQPVGASRTGLKASKLMEVERVVAEASKARDAGATRYCMGAAWRSPKARDMDAVVAMVDGVKALGMETCMTLGMLDREQARSPEAGGPRLLQPQHRYVGALLRRDHHHAQLSPTGSKHSSMFAQAGIKVCCGGIVGMGEEQLDRVDMLVTLANLAEHPESVPINMLIPIAGTPLAEAGRIEPIEFVRIDRTGPHHDAEIVCPAVGRPHRHERRDAGAVLLCRRQFDFRRRHAADCRQSGKRGDRKLLNRLD